MNKRTFIIWSGLTVLAVVGLTAQSLEQKTPAPIGSTVKGFVLDQRDPQTGELKATLRGATAKVLTVNRTEITDMAVEMMSGDKVSMTMTSPKCNYWHLEGRLSTNNSVKIMRDDLEIEAQNMEWDYKERKGVLRNNVKVIMKGIDLGSPAEPATKPASAVPETKTEKVAP
jgi:hypothetical protein